MYTHWVVCYYVPRVRTKLGERAFSYAGPVVWNNLPADIRVDCRTRHYTFQEHSSDILFRLAFDLLG